MYLLQLLISILAFMMNYFEISVAQVSNNPGTLNSLQPQAPNFQYFERPKYRYPYYDENGKGYILYGTGDGQLHQYRKFSLLEGVY